MMRTAALTVLLAIAPAGLAEAQGGFGDTQLTYRGGVVWDDDVVPGLPPDQPFLAEEQRSAPLSEPGSAARAPAILLRPDERSGGLLDRNQPDTDRLGPSLR